MKSSFVVFLALSISLSSALPQAKAEVGAHWPQWRGPERDGSLPGPAFPQALDEAHLESQWKVSLEPSYSGPIIKNGLIYTTETANKEREVVRAYALESGAEQWKADWEGMMRVPFFAKANGSWIRSTPATDGERLFVAGMRDRLVCLDAESGEELWVVDFMKQFGTELPSFGCVSSPLIAGESVIVQAGASVVALDKREGKVLWRALEDAGGMNGSAFSSPIIQQLHGQPQLLIQTRTALAGLEPTTGKVHWKQEIPAFRGMNILTPTTYNDLIFTTAYGGKALGLTLERNESQWKARPAWELKLEGYMSSPVIIDGHAYVHLRNQRFACVNLATGEKRWQTKEKFGKYWSMVARGNQLLALDEQGELLLIHANPESFDLRARRSLNQRECWAHLALAGDHLAIRSLNQLEVFRWNQPEA